MRIVIIGDGTARHGLDGYLRANRELSSYVHLPGQIGNVAEWLNSFDVFVLPSLSEGMSNCLLEAMAAGVVPVATNVGGNPEVIVDGESGLLVPPKDPDAICDRLVRLAGAPDLRREIGIKARLRVESRFSLQRMLRRYEQMYSHPVEQDQASCPVASQAS